MTTDTRLRSDEESSHLADAARNVADQAGQTVEAQASTTMDQITTSIEEVARAVRRAGEELRQEQPQIASMVDKAADQVERAATYLESHEPREVLETIQENARRQPALVIGTGIAVGLVLGRLLRTALPVDQPDARTYGTATGRNGERNEMSSMGNGAGRPTNVSDPNASIVASTRVVKAGGAVDTGSPRPSGE